MLNRHPICRAWAIATAAAWSSFAFAFDGGAHFDMTGDAMESEGFSEAAAAIVQLSCLIAAAPRSFKGLESKGNDAPGWLPKDELRAEDEWDRLARATRETLRQASQSGDVPAALAALGISLNRVQAFYSRTNWAEPAPSGPGWASHGRYGTHPTWYDVPDRTRSGVTLSKRDAPAPGSPRYVGAFVTASIASRQWVRAVRIWTSNETFWRRMIGYSASVRELKEAADGAWRYLAARGQWNGDAGLPPPKPGPPAPALPSSLRNKWEVQHAAIEKADPPVAPIRVMPSGHFLPSTQFLELLVTQVEPVGATVRRPFWYGKATIATRTYRSGFLPGPTTKGPMSFVRMAPTQQTSTVPLSSMRITLRTGNHEASGTDMRLYLRINESTRYDFYLEGLERAQTRSFVFVPDGVTLDRLAFIQLEKVGGSDWELAAIRIEVNGTEVYRNDSVNAWLRSVNQSWRAPGWNPLSRYTIESPVRLELWDADPEKPSADEQADINPLVGRSFLQLLYHSGTRKIRLDAAGTEAVSCVGAGDAHPTRISFAVRSISVKPPAGSG